MAAGSSAPVKVPGLERLLQLATVNIHQTSSGYKGNNYTVLSEDEALFTMNEDLPDSFFHSGGAKRPFIFDGVENTGRKMFRFLRPVGRVFISDTVELYIENQLASVIRRENTFMRPIFTINDPQQQPVIRLKGGPSKTYELQTNTKEPIGSIEKQWRGWKEELFSYNDNYIIKFPADLAVQYKLAVIVACVYIDFVFNEGK